LPKNETINPKETRTMSPTEDLSTIRIWGGRIMGALPALFMLVDGGMKLFKPAVVVESTLQLGYPESAIIGMGLALLISTILYLFPVIFGVLLWGSLWLRDTAVSRLLPIRSV
jgi:hypothetical protein